MFEVVFFINCSVVKLSPVALLMIVVLVKQLHCVNCNGHPKCNIFAEYGVHYLAIVKYTQTHEAFYCDLDLIYSGEKL